MIVTLAIAMVVSFVAPIIAVMVPLISGIASGGLFHFGQARSAQAWHGAIYYVTFGTGRVQPVWRSDGAGDSTRVTSTEARFPWLVATDADLWFFGDGRVERFDGTRVDSTLVPTGYFAHRPFVFRGRPAILDKQPARLVLSTWDGRGFVEAAELSCDCSGVSEHALSAVANGETIDLFLLWGTDVRYRRASPGADVGDPTAWTRVAADVARLEVAPLRDGGSALGLGRLASRRSTEVELLRGDGTGFKPLAKRTLATPMSLWGLTSDPALDRAYLVSSGDVSGDLVIQEISPSGAVVERRPSSGSGLLGLMIWPNLVSLLCGLLVSFVAAGLLSGWMRAFRGDTLEVAGRSVELGSILRRGLGQLTDTVIRSVPFIVVVGLLVSGRLDWHVIFMPPKSLLYIFGFVVVSFAWTLIDVTMMSLLEWKTGKTPGKWLFGLRVISADDEPIGFGRALARNLLEWGDGMFLFIVGMGAAALTEKRQRLGDLAARTLVVRE